MKAKLLGFAFLAAAPIFAAGGSIGIQIGPPPPPRVETVRPARPGADWIWVDGYWYPEGRRYVWHKGYWSRPPYPGARWVAPHHDGQRFFEGYWEGEHGQVRHDHAWDRDKNRDFGHDHHDDHDRH